MPGPAPAYRPAFPPAFLEQAERVVHQRTVAFQLRQLPGYSKDPKANLAEAKRLLAEAGYPDGFKHELSP